jgi:hypothetical protein
VVQALRYDEFGMHFMSLIQCESQMNISTGYVARFIFETAKISQLFCHQIIWNMKANCYKDDTAEVVSLELGCVLFLNQYMQEDSLKPALDLMTNQVVASLSGEAREFYDREFGFFDEVTSISGTLKPFIKKTKPEKKVSRYNSQAKIKSEYSSRQKLTKRWQKSTLRLAYTYQVIQTAR